MHPDLNPKVDHAEWAVIYFNGRFGSGERIAIGLVMLTKERQRLILGLTVHLDVLKLIYPQLDLESVASDFQVFSHRCQQACEWIERLPRHARLHEVLPLLGSWDSYTFSTIKHEAIMAATSVDEVFEARYDEFVGFREPDRIRQSQHQDAESVARSVLDGFSSKDGL